MAAPPTQILIYSRDRLIHQQLLPPGDYIIGGDASADIAIEVEGLAARHAALSLEEREWLIEDLGSESGTFVNGERVTSRRTVFPSEKIRVGQATISLRRAAEGDDSSAHLPHAEVLRELLPEETRNIHKYEIGPELARGGMGVIHDAHDTAVQRNVAMKLMRDCTVPDQVARFVQEAQVTARLEHPNIVPVHELSVNERGEPFYTMKFVRGVSLGKVLELLSHSEPTTVEKYPLSALLTIFQKLCDAIAFAHSKGVIHRDLKPDNIMLGEYGEALVMDWGLAKVLGSESAWTITDGAATTVTTSSGADVTMAGGTMAGTVVGTPQYMSPEQANGENVDAATDIYALGALLYHILALRPPIAGKDSDEVLANVRAGKIEPLTATHGTRRLLHLPGERIPESLAAVVKQAMAHDPSVRYVTVKELQSDLEAYQAGFATSAENASAWKLAALFLRRHRTISIAAALLLLAGAIFSVYLARARNVAEAAEQLANAQRDSTEDALYLADMLQVGRDLQDGRPAVALEVLQRHHREASGRNLRDWEWYHLLGELNLDRLRVHAHDGGVYAVAASSDGARLATGGGDGDLAVWHTRGLRPDFRVRAHEGTVFAVAWQTGGPLLATGGADGMVRVWDGDSHEKVAELRVGSGQAIRALAWQPKRDGSGVLAIGGADKEVRIWHPSSGNPTGTLETLLTKSKGVSSLHWSADAVRLAIGEVESDKKIEVFDFNSRDRVPLSTQGFAGQHVLAVALTPNGKYVAAGSKHLDVAVFDVAGKPPVFLQPLHRSFVSAVAWSPNGRTLASGSYDGTIRLSSPFGSVPVSQVFSGHTGEINALIWTEFSSDVVGGQRREALFSGGADGTLRAWAPGIDYDAPIVWLGAARWSPDGRRAASASFGDFVDILDAASGASYPLYVRVGGVFDLAWSPHGDQLAAASRDNNMVGITEISTGRRLQRFTLAGADRLAWSPSGNYLAAGSANGTRIWNAESGELLMTSDQPSGSLAWNPDERRIAVGAKDGGISIWDPFTGRKLADWRAAPSVPLASIPSKEDPPRQVLDLRWSADGRELAFGTQDSAAGVLTGPDGQLTRTFAGHPSGVWRIAWSGNGRRVATCGQDGAVRVFEAATGNLVASFNHGLKNMELHAVDWSPDSCALLSAGYDGAVRIWDSLRGLRIDAISELERRAQDAPRNPDVLRNLAQGYAQLGWADRARETFARARELAPQDATLVASAEEAERGLADALIGTAFRPDRPKDAPMLDPQALALLNTTCHSWEKKRPQEAVGACRKLLKLPEAKRFEQVIWNYLSRADWKVSLFPSPVDPRNDLAAWRTLSTKSEAVTLGTRILEMPYRRRSPKAMFATPEFEGKDIPADRFGMIAHATIQLPAGKWRFHARGNDGIRVIVDGKTIIDDWTGAAPVEQSGDFEQIEIGKADVIVEHYALHCVDEFLILLELVE